MIELPIASSLQSFCTVRSLCQVPSTRQLVLPHQQHEVGLRVPMVQREELRLRKVEAPV